MDDSVTLQCSLSEREWIRAANARHGLIRSWSLPALWGAVLASVMAPTLLQVTSDCGCGSRRSWIVVGSWALMALAFAAIIRFMWNRQIRQALKKNPYLLSPMELRLAADGFYESQKLLQTFRPWAAFTGWSERGDVAYLHVGVGPNGAFVMLPHAQATPEQWQRAREILLAQLGPPTR